jgi:hypothetical protein
MLLFALKSKSSSLKVQMWMINPNDLAFYSKAEGLLLL